MRDAGDDTHRHRRGRAVGVGQRRLFERIRHIQSPRQIIKPLLEILAAVPTVVYGYFALLFVTPLLKTFIPGLSGFNALSAGLVMGVMIIPLVSSLSEDAMHAVPMGLREGAYALGSRKIQVAFKIVFPRPFQGSRRPSSWPFRGRSARP